MEQQRFRYNKYNWNLIICYDVIPKDEAYILTLLQPIITNKELIQSAINTLYNKNNAFTCTDFNNKLSVVSISRTSSPSEFINSITHESKHIMEDICSYYDIPLYGEESAYMIGEIVMIMFKVFKKYICTCCYC